MNETKHPVFVQVVDGKPYSFSGHLRFVLVLIVAPLIAFAVTGDWIHLAGIGAVILIGCMGANPRLSPVGAGCLPFLLFMAVVVLTIAQPRLGIPLLVWSTIAWLVSSIDLRLQMKPYSATPESPCEQLK